MKSLHMDKKYLVILHKIYSQLSILSDLIK